MVVAVAVGSFLDVGLAFLVVPRTEFEAVVLVVETHLFQFVGCGVRAPTELVNVIEGRIVAIKEIDEHVLYPDVTGFLDDPVDLLNDFLGGHNLTVALDLAVVLGVLAEACTHLHYADVAAGEVAVLFELLAGAPGRAVDVSAE